MKLPAILLFFATTALAQNNEGDTHPNPLMERRVHETYTEEITFMNKRREVAIVRTFSPSGQRITEEHYENYDQGIKHGLTRCWYPNGQTYWSSDFKHGDLNGPLLVYYTDGAAKRREYFKQGTSRKSTCFDPQGVAHPCDAFAKPASFSGTANEFQATLKKQLTLVGFELRNQEQYISYQGIIEENGQMTGITVYPTGHELTEPLKKALSGLPRWKPATVDNEPVATHYYQTLLILGREIYVNKH